ncbi:MAG TPA: tyrosine-type recombinase/integrase [Streptosporangiaceae bacterium]|nr:tyrosine-type recombinase/integrase [Streptosporangiaceae bacterium]
MPNSKGRRRRFGSIRKLPSGRYQARYPGPDGVMRPADDTFATKTEADNWLTTKEAEIIEGDWIDPDASDILIPDYAATWIKERPGLRPKTIGNYRSALRRNIAPHLATVTVGELTLAGVRRWRTNLLESGTGPVAVAKAYRFLRAVMNTAVDDGLIKRNPCRIKGAGSENSPERPILSVAQVYALADAVGLRNRALILLAAFTSLRWSELAALRPEDIDLDACTVRVTRQLNKGGVKPVFGPLKSRAGRRVVDFADLIVPDLREHLRSVPPGALVFTSPEGFALSNSNFRRRVWAPALAAVGLEGVHIHDLRHTGNQFTADAGANTRELMARMGHDSDRAALIYMHSTDQRQRALADAVGKAARAELAKAKKSAAPRRSGMRMARRQDAD